MSTQPSDAVFISAYADVDLTGSEYRVVVASTGANGLIGASLPGAAGARALGILAPGDRLTAGSTVRVCIAGGFKVEANGAFASVDDVLSVAATTGRVDTAVSTHFPIGRTHGVNASAQGQIVPCIVEIANAPLA